MDDLRLLLLRISMAIFGRPKRQPRGGSFALSTIQRSFGQAAAKMENFVGGGVKTNDEPGSAVIVSAC